MNRSFWRGRRVFVTGHTGFKGSWLLLMLQELGAEVYGFSLAPPTTPSLFELLGLEANCTHRVGDVRHLPAVEEVMQEAQPEVVLHMAAQSLVRTSYVNPVETYSVNMMGTVNVLDACRRADRLRAAVMVTTDKCYENLGWTWGYRENDRLGGADPYSNSKAACELAVDAYRSSFFNPPQHARHGKSIASARAGNVIGGGDFAPDRLVPDAMRAFMAGEPLLVRNPLSIRPWQHVLEPLSGYLLLAERLHGDPAFGGAWNFGPQTDESAPVRQIVDVLAHHWWGSAAWEQDPREHPHEAETLKLDSTKARIELGWSPKFTLDQALRTTVDWYKAYHVGANVAEITAEQIRAYLSASSAHEEGTERRVRSGYGSAVAAEGQEREVG